MKTHYRKKGFVSICFTEEKLTELRNMYLETHSRFLLSLLPLQNWKAKL